MRWGILALVGALVPFAAGAAEGVFWTDAVQHRHPPSQIARVAEAALPAVVSITTTERQSPDSDEAPQQGVGAGFILTSDGYVLTCAHVVDDARSVKVTMQRPSGDRQTLPARIVGVDEETDFALLKIDPRHPLPVLALGSAHDVGVADWVVVIGSPFGLARSVSVGVVSYKGRTDVTPSGRSGYFDYLQTDAAINPGNSGGPILDVDGNVVAIANAVNVAGQGIGFAVPVDIAKRVLPDLKSLGHVRRAWMGIAVEDVEAADDARTGVRISKVLPNSPASKAGLRVGDLITALSGQRIRHAEGLRWNVGNAEIGQPLILSVHREGHPLTVQVVPSLRPTRKTARRRKAEGAPITRE